MFFDLTLCTLRTYLVDPLVTTLTAIWHKWKSCYDIVVKQRWKKALNVKEIENRLLILLVLLLENQIMSKQRQNTP